MEPGLARVRTTHSHNRTGDDQGESGVDGVEPGVEMRIHDAVGGGTEPAARDVEDDLRAWLCVLGGFAFSIPSYGFMQSIGTIQSYLQLNQLSAYTTSQVGWISGMYLFMSYFFNIQIGPICDYDGPVVVGSVGVAITIASFLLLAECSTYYQFMLCHGLMGALGGATVATAAMSAIAKLFSRRRGLAMGAALTGSAVGSIIFPLILRAVLPKLGWRWSMRIIASAIAGITIPAIFCFKPYAHLTAHMSHQRLQSRGEALLDLSAFKSASFSLISVGSFLLEFAIFGISGLLPTVAVAAGFAPEDGYLLITVLSICSCFGRMLPGLVADFIGPFNVIIFTSTFTLIFMAGLFIPFAGSHESILYAFAAMWGFGSGSFLSIPPVCLGRVCATKDYGRFFGTMTFFCSFAVLLSVPLGGIMLESLGVRALGGLLTAVVFSGELCYIAARMLNTNYLSKRFLRLRCE